MKPLEILKRCLVWIAELFTEAKSFESNPILGSRVLNALGLHVIRVIIAHSMTSLRRLFLSRSLPREERLAFKEAGFIQIDNALNEQAFAQSTG